MTDKIRLYNKNGEYIGECDPKDVIPARPKMTRRQELLRFVEWAGYDFLEEHRGKKNFPEDDVRRLLGSIQRIVKDFVNAKKAKGQS